MEPYTAFSTFLMNFCRLQNLKNVGVQKENNMKQFDPAAYQALLWLRAHKNELQGVVHEPVRLVIQMSDLASGNSDLAEAGISIGQANVVVSLLLCRRR